MRASQVSIWGGWNKRDWLSSGQDATRKFCTSESQMPKLRHLLGSPYPYFILEKTEAERGSNLPKIIQRTGEELGLMHCIPIECSSHL